MSDHAALTTEDLAAEAGVHVETVRRWVREKRLPDRREETGHRRVMYFLASDVDRAQELAAETSDGPMHRLPVSLPLELRDRLKDLAAAQRRPLAALCREALWRYLVDAEQRATPDSENENDAPQDAAPPAPTP